MTIDYVPAHNIVIPVPPGAPIFGFGDASFGVEGFGSGYWAVVVYDTPYVDLITSEHADKPKYMTMIAETTRAWVEEQETLVDFVPSYDLDTAIGDQLDVLGLWIGLGRTIQIPLVGVFFSFDTPGAGFDQAPWYHIGNALFSSYTMPDDFYRRALRAKAAANIWDGTYNGAYEVYDIFFRGTANEIKIHDNQDMTYSLEITGPTPDMPTQAIISQDYLGLRPQGVRLTGVTIP